MHIERSVGLNNLPEQYVEGFQVTFYSNPQTGEKWPATAVEISEASLSEVIDWAEGEAGSRLYSVAIVSWSRWGRMSLVPLIGRDINDDAGGHGLGDDERRLKQEMFKRRTQRRLKKERDAIPRVMGYRAVEDFDFLDDPAVPAEEKWQRTLRVIRCGDPSRELPGQIAIARTLITIAYHRQMGDYEVPKLHHRLSIGHRIIELTGEADPVLVAAGLLNGIGADTSLTTAEMVERGVSGEVLSLLADLDEYEQLPYEKKRLIWQELPLVDDYSAETLAQLKERAQPYAAKYVDVQVLTRAEANITAWEGHNYYA